jgi:hypothetical protein
MSAHRWGWAGRQQTRWPLTGYVQPEPGEVQGLLPTLTGMNNIYDTPAGGRPRDLGGLGGLGDPGGLGGLGDGAGPAGGHGSGYGSYGRLPAAPAGKKRMVRWGAGITLAGFLAGGGIALALSGGSAPAASTASAVSAPQGRPGSGQGQGTTLNSALSTADSTTPVPLPRLRRALARLRALGGVHGEFTFQNKTGFHTLAFERGTIQSVTGTDVVVQAPDGTSWTWAIVSNTVVRENGSKTTTGALSAGESVFAGGPVADGARDARLIVIRPSGSGSSGSGSSSGSVSGPSGTSVN